MSSPTSRATRYGDSPTGNGSVSDASPATPRQRPAARRLRPNRASPVGALRAPMPRLAEPVHFGHGGAGRDQNTTTRGRAGTGSRADESRQSDAYASDPDLSGPIPRAGQLVGRAFDRTSRMMAPVRSEGRYPGVVAARRPGSGRHADPGASIRGSTSKVLGVLSVALFFVSMIAVGVPDLVLGGIGVSSKLNSDVGIC